ALIIVGRREIIQRGGVLEAAVGGEGVDRRGSRIEYDRVAIVRGRRAAAARRAAAGVLQHAGAVIAAILGDRANLAVAEIGDRVAAVVAERAADRQRRVDR